jgi:hypothetical protein
MNKVVISKNPNAKDEEIVSRITKIRDSKIDMRDKRTAAAILIRKNSVSRTMQTKNILNQTDIDHQYPVKKQLDDIFLENKSIEEVLENSHNLQEEDPSVNRGKAKKK